MIGDHSSGDDARTKFSVHDFFVDFLGGLVPGTLLIFGFAVSVIPPLLGLLISLNPSTEHRKSSADEIADSIAEVRTPQGAYLPALTHPIDYRLADQTHQSRSIGTAGYLSNGGMRKTGGVSPTDLVSLIAALISAAENTPSAFWIGGFGAMACLAYLVGHLVYRRDPKIPDKKSFMKLRQNMQRELRRNRRRKFRRRLKRILRRKERFLDLRALLMSFFVIGLRRFRQKGRSYKEHRLSDLLDRVCENEYGCRSEADCEFPYPKYDSYLRQRGLFHLLPFVKWSGESFWRSKTYINLLKIRLRFYFPQKCSSIIRNEGHVRLASSAWFAARLLRYSCMISFGIFVIIIIDDIDLIFAAANAVSVDRSNILTQTFSVIASFLESVLLNIFSINMYISIKHHSSILIPMLFVLILSELTRSRVEKFLHYQRMREVFFVLETSYSAFRRSNNISLLNPPFRL